MSESPAKPSGFDGPEKSLDDDAHAGGESVQVACFFVGSEEYALDIMRIKEIINPVPVTRVPRAPVFIEGIIELRGAFLPVIDLRRRFELPVTELTRDTKYVIVALAGRILGLVVDRVAEVKPIPVDQISAAPELAVAGDSVLLSPACASFDMYESYEHRGKVFKECIKTFCDAA